MMMQADLRASHSDTQLTKVQSEIRRSRGNRRREGSNSSSSSSERDKKEVSVFIPITDDEVLESGGMFELEVCTVGNPRLSSLL